MSAAPALSPPVNESSFIQIDLALGARDRLSLTLEVSSAGDVIQSKLTGVGCTELLKAIADGRERLKGRLADVVLPEENGHAALLMRELILKAQGRWAFPYPDEELCHCRGVATRKVDDAVVSGCHSVESLKRATSASTSCGTCRWDLERILEYRLRKT